VLAAGCARTAPDGAASRARPRAVPTAAAPSTSAGPAPVQAPTPTETGTDFVAIARSIDEYHGWLLAHRPDPALARVIYQPGTQSYLEFTRNLTALRARSETLVSIGQRCTYALASVQPALVTLRVHEVIAEDRTLDRQGRVVRVTPYAAPNDYVVVLTRDAGARWRLADITQVAS
jgi:hypothetical protein